MNEVRDFNVANEISKETKYKLLYEDKPNVGSGYKDWFIKKFKKPGFTVEIGKGENPLPISMAEEVYKEAEGILLEGLK